MSFDASRAKLKQPDMFQRFRVNSAGTPLRELRLPTQEGLLVFERGGERRALLSRQMVYHHVAQGKLAGEAYLITF